MKSQSLIALLALGALATATPGAWAQGPTMKQQQDMQRVPLAPIIKVEVTQFTASPAHPRAGEQVTLTLKIKNTGPNAGAVPLRITWFGAERALVVEVKALEVGQEFTKTVRWQAVAGGHGFRGEVAPWPGRPFPNTAAAASRSRDLDLWVAQPHPDDPKKKEEKKGPAPD